MARLLYFTCFIVLLHAAVLYIAVLDMPLGNLVATLCRYLSVPFRISLLPFALGLSGMAFAGYAGLANGLTPWMLWYFTGYTDNCMEIPFDQLFYRFLSFIQSVCQPTSGFYRRSTDLVFCCRQRHRRRKAFLPAGGAALY